MGRFTFDFGWSRRVPEHEGSLRQKRMRLKDEIWRALAAV